MATRGVKLMASLDNITSQFEATLKQSSVLEGKVSRQLVAGQVGRVAVSGHPRLSVVQAQAWGEIRPGQKCLVGQDSSGNWHALPAGAGTQLVRRQLASYRHVLPSRPTGVGRIKILYTITRNGYWEFWIGGDSQPRKVYDHPWVSDGKAFYPQSPRITNTGETADDWIAYLDFSVYPGDSGYTPGTFSGGASSDIKIIILTPTQTSVLTQSALSTDSYAISINSSPSGVFEVGFNPKYVGNGYVTSVPNFMTEYSFGLTASRSYPSGFYQNAVTTDNWIVDFDNSSVDGSAEISFDGLQYPCHSTFVFRTEFINGQSDEIIEFLQNQGYVFGSISNCTQGSGGVYPDGSLYQTTICDFTYIDPNGIFNVTYTNAYSSQSVAFPIRLYPLATSSVLDVGSGSSVYDGIVITPCDQFDFVRFRVQYRSSGSALFSDRHFPIVTNTIGDRLISLKWFGGEHPDTEQIALSRWIGASSLDIAEIGLVGLTDRFLLLLTDGNAGKKRHLDYIGDSLFVTMDEYEHLVNLPVGEARPYFSENAEVLLYSSPDSEVRFEPQRTETILSLDVADKIYGLDFRVEDMSYG